MQFEILANKSANRLNVIRHIGAVKRLTAEQQTAQFEKRNSGEQERYKYCFSTPFRQIDLLKNK